MIQLSILTASDAVYKAAKTYANGDVKGNGIAAVEDADEDDIEAGPALPPDEEEENIDDEEGRFFGGGITNDTADVLNFIDERDKGNDAVRYIFPASSVLHSLRHGTQHSPSNNGGSTCIKKSTYSL